MSLPRPPPDPARPTLFSDEAWVEVLSAMDRTYADLVDYQERLERQNAELQEMRTFLTAILSSVSDVLIVAGRTGQVEQVSRSVLTLTGRPEAQVVNAGLVELFAEPQRPVLAALLQGVREQRRSASLECDLLTPEGMEPLELSAAPRLDEKGAGRRLCADRASAGCAAQGLCRTFRKPRCAEDGAGLSGQERKAGLAGPASGRGGA